MLISSERLITLEGKSHWLQPRDDADLLASTLIIHNSVMVQSTGRGNYPHAQRSDFNTANQNTSSQTQKIEQCLG
jgi:hypothetical protein